jgi:hypothetical protein
MQRKRQWMRVVGWGVQRNRAARAAAVDEERDAAARSGYPHYNVWRTSTGVLYTCAGSNLHQSSDAGAKSP